MFDETPNYIKRLQSLASHPKVDVKIKGDVQRLLNEYVELQVELAKAKATITNINLPQPPEGYALTVVGNIMVLEPIKNTAHYFAGDDDAS